MPPPYSNRAARGRSPFDGSSHPAALGSHQPCIRPSRTLSATTYPRAHAHRPKSLFPSPVLVRPSAWRSAADVGGHIAWVPLVDTAVNALFRARRSAHRLTAQSAHDRIFDRAIHMWVRAEKRCDPGNPEVIRHISPACLGRPSSAAPRLGRLAHSEHQHRPAVASARNHVLRGELPGYPAPAAALLVCPEISFRAPRRRAQRPMRNGSACCACALSTVAIT